MLGFAPLASGPLADDGGDNNAIFSVTGVSAVGFVSEVAVAADSNLNPVGIIGTGEVDSVAVSAGSGIDVALTGAEISGLIGSVEVTTGAGIDVFVVGVEAAGGVGRILIWGRVVPATATVYSEITPATATVWTEIAA